MGLDIYASKNVKQVVNPRVDDADELDKVYHGNFPYQAGTLVDGGYYDCEDGEHFFRMGYGHYGCFREALAEVAGYEKKEVPEPKYGDDDYENKRYFYQFPYTHRVYENDYGDGSPFIEVIAFSDCEGYVCADVCKKLYADFEKYLEEAENKMDEYFFNSYKDLMAAFKYGSENGYVRYS